jgi:class 3 adenylate cyclase/predicted ATPase
MKCAKCGAENRDGAKFCNECAAPIEASCPSCGSRNKPGAKFCDECGTSLGSSAAVSLKKPNDSPIRVNDSAVAENLDGERKTVTALFADIKGSTEMMRDLDPEEARAIIDPALNLMIEAVHRYDGYVVQSTGDGIFALFGAPVAHEDHPQRALHAAIATRDELVGRVKKLRMRGRARVEVRIGVNTGEVVMRTVQTSGHTEYAPVGHVINLAARMQSIARPGGIVVSDDTRRLVEGYFELHELGPKEVKGVSEPVNAYEVVGVGPLRGHFDVAARRGLTKFVGRENELQQIKRALELAIRGHGQIVAVVAEAGTGKSRLFYEFKATIPAECKLLEGYSVSHGRASAWLPVLELLRNHFGIKDTDDPAARRKKVRTALEALDFALAETMPYLFALLGIQDSPDPLAQMDPQIKRRRTLDAIKRLILSESLNRPTVVVFEDLHWVDNETQALLNLLADSIANTRVLLLVNYRPEYRHEWTNRSYYSQLRLLLLGTESTGEMLGALLGEAGELAPLKRLLSERTEGNPFFIEETVQALFDEGALVRNGTVKVTRALSQMRIPPTVQGILASRIDRLPGEHKQLLQTLAVIGREAPLGLLKAIEGTADAPLERMLADLRAAEFICEQPASADTGFIFKHALTQEVTYNSILIERRKLLHERTGQVIEQLFAEKLDDRLGELARHYSHSNNLAKAVDYLDRAGQQALQRSAYAEASARFTAEIELLQTLPDSSERIQQELTIQQALGAALIAVKGWASPEVERAYTRARELSERLGDPPELFSVLWGVWSVYLVRAELRAALELAERLQRRAQSAQDPTLLMLAHCAMGQTLMFMGNLLLAKEHLEMGISLYDPQLHRPLALVLGTNVKIECLTNACWTLWTLGYPDQALKRGDEALALAQAGPDPFLLAFVETTGGFLHQFRGEPSAAEECAEHAIQLSGEHGFSFFSGVATILRGWASAVPRRNKDGGAEIQEGLDALSTRGAELMRPYGLCFLAEACSEVGRIDDALSAVTEALAFAAEHEERVWEAETHRLRGDLLLQQDDSKIAEAQICFQKAIDIARNQHAKSLELRSAMSLARLLANQGRRDEARTMLAEIYGWFTEGFDTRDLQQAKQLLNELDQES